MAPSSGFHLVPKAVDAIRSALSRSSAYVKARLSGSANPHAPAELVPALARQPIPRLAIIRQARSAHHRLSQQLLGGQHQARHFSTLFSRFANRYASSGARPTSARLSLPASATRAALSRTTHAPFASPLRPNLTGGALPRGAGGYGLGSGGFGAARHFSHSGSAHAQSVVQNVHAAVRAFCVQGYTARYDGVDPTTGRSRFCAVSAAQHRLAAASCNLDPWAEKGTSLDFKIAPTVTALATVAEGAWKGGATTAVLDAGETLPALAGDFARQVADLAAVHADLKRLARFGGLPVCLPDPATLRVRFPGCDGPAVYSLCAEAGVTRGVVREDEAWRTQDDAEDASPVPPAAAAKDVEMALLFPWAPDEDDAEAAAAYFEAPPKCCRHRVEWRSMLSEPSDSPVPGLAASPGLLGNAVWVDDPKLARPLSSSPRFSADEAFESVAASEEYEADFPAHMPLQKELAQGYEGVQGIYRFLSELEAAERR